MRKNRLKNKKFEERKKKERKKEKKKERQKEAKKIEEQEVGGKRKKEEKERKKELSFIYTCLTSVQIEADNEMITKRRITEGIQTLVSHTYYFQYFVLSVNATNVEYDSL